MRRSRRTLLVGCVLLAIVGVVLLSLGSRTAPHVREQVVASVNERFQAGVSLDAFQVGVFPRPEVTGSGLVVSWHGRSDVPPLIRIGSFGASAGVFGLVGTPVRLRTVQLDRLEIHIPPGGINKGRRGSESAPDSGSRRFPTRLTIDEIVASAAQLRIASKEPGKLPRTFDIHDLHIFDYGEQDGAAFRASLTNPTPRGHIATNGVFGPWRADEPRATPIVGKYTFTSANMNTIKGLGGTLSSQGEYNGVLERIAVAGETNTPDFSIDIAGQPVPLKTRFKAIVDGTNGNTYLEQVDAQLLESHILATGSVVRTEDVKGRHVALDIVIDRARIEDLLRLAVKGAKSPLTGGVRLKTNFTLPAGEADVIDRLQLAGEFVLDEARFTDFDVQKRINLLSQKGRGDDALEPGESVVSALRGRFVLKNATLSFRNLTFAVPGAIVQLAGTYDLSNQGLAFAGDLLLDASLAETTSGMKAVIATIAQPLFRRKGGGSRIPIKVGGTRSKPTFGLDVKRVFGRE
jgi:hypothetical protein